MQSRLNLLFVLPTTNLPCSPQTHFRRTAKETTEQDTNVTDCNRLFPLAHQTCKTLDTSRNTARNGSYPEKSKRTLQLASTEYDGIGARTTQHDKVPTKTLQHNSCFHVVFLLPLRTTSGSSKNCACALDHERTRDQQLLLKHVPYVPVHV